MNTEFLNTFQNGIIPGSIAGFIQVIAGHPLDTIKVHIQTTGKYRKGVKHLYRGVVYPLIANVPTIAVQFGTENMIKQNIRIKDNNLQSFVSGACTGVIMSPLMSIVELYKIRRQTFITSQQFSLTLGMRATCIREIFGISTYFGVYNYLSNKLDYLNLFNRSFISGGIAGGLCWTICYPFDVIKTRIQKSECKNIREAYSKGKLWKGVGICTFRGVIANGFGFMVLEMYRENRN